jgi:hypothetical protein
VWYLGAPAQRIYPRLDDCLLYSVDASRSMGIFGDESAVGGQMSPFSEYDHFVKERTRSPAEEG